jgi:hypothetical protein
VAIGGGTLAPVLFPGEPWQSRGVRRRSPGSVKPRRIEEVPLVINGVHALVYSREPEAVRALFRDVLGLASVDAGDGWLIFALPPAEVAVHPTEEAGHHELYLMCEDIDAVVLELGEKGIRCSPVEDQGWGLVTMVALPGDDELGLYEPRHDTALGLTQR